MVSRGDEDASKADSVISGWVWSVQSLRCRPEDDWRALVRPEFTNTLAVS